jgi:hypothetical protein
MTDFDQQPPHADLARLADGSLPASRQAELRAEVDRSPELVRALSEQQHAIALLRSTDVVAPDSLRMQVEQEIRTATRPRRRRFRFSWAIPAVTTLTAAAAVAIVLLTGGSGSSAPSLSQATHLALAAAVYPAPSEAHANTLNETAAGITFPYWQRSVGWRAVGSRVDRLSSRSVVTVFYTNPRGERVGYAIVGGAALPVSGGTTTTKDGISFTLLRQGSARLVTWLRAGHTCVIAGREVSDQTLLALATAEIPQ